MKRRRRLAASEARCVLDSGGLSALFGPTQRARAWLRWIVEHDGIIIVPTPVLVEATTGDAGRDAEIDRILNVLSRATLALRAPDEATCRCAGKLRHRAGSDDGIDALIAAAALGDGAPCVLLTSDPADLTTLLSDSPQVVIRTV